MQIADVNTFLHTGKFCISHSYTLLRLDKKSVEIHWESRQMYRVYGEVKQERRYVEAFYIWREILVQYTSFV